MNFQQSEHPWWRKRNAWHMMFQVVLPKSDGTPVWMRHGAGWSQVAGGAVRVAAAT